MWWWDAEAADPILKKTQARICICDAAWGKNGLWHQKHRSAGLEPSPDSLGEDVRREEEKEEEELIL